MTPRHLAFLLALRRRAGDGEAAQRLTAVILWLLWAEVAAASGRNDHRGEENSGPGCEDDDRLGVLVGVEIDGVAERVHRRTGREPLRDEGERPLTSRARGCR